MYTEEPRRSIDWGNVIKKGLIILVVVAIIFLIVWLFTRNNSNSINVNYEDENTKVNETLTNPDAYSETFINNYRYFHDTAKEYFLISELPTPGNTLKYTLQQLIDKGLILPFGYGDETCDVEASYVTVTNNNGEYTMTTTLVCGKEVAKTTEELGCNQLCTDKNCTESKVVEYQYKQAYKANETVYSCPSGYTRSGSKCYKSTSSTTTASKITTYICPDGYNKTGSGENTKCTKGSETIINATPKTTYSCSKGTLSGNKCIIETTANATPKTTYSCSKGTLSGTKCVTTTNATPKTTYSCSSGTLSGNKCVTTTNAKASTSYSCSSGTLSGNKCTITKAANKNTTNYCDNGYTRNGNSCVKYIYTDISYGKTYNGCTGGQLVKSQCSNGNCTTSKYMYVCSKGVSSKTTYTCDSGYTKSGSGENTKCTKTVTATPKTTYSCSSGTLSGTKCVTSTNAKANTTYSCSSGTLSGTKCVTSTNATSQTTYSCSKGTLSGTKCIIPSSINATPKTTYNCPDGFDKYGTNKCKSDGTTSANPIKNVNYTCPSGYTKTGIGSSSICTKGSSTSIDATKSTKTVTKYKYKWSKETSLDGWEKTGKTREVSSN